MPLLCSSRSTSSATQRPIPQPVSDDVFAAYASQFAYRPGDLNATQPCTMATTDDWIKQRVTIDTGYNGERMDVILFVPTRFRPPFQTDRLHLGSQRVALKDSSDRIEPGFDACRSITSSSPDACSFSRFPRNLLALEGPYDPNDEVRTTREWIERRWDLGRTIDYLETRPDIDAAHIGYIGMSFGASSRAPARSAGAATESCGFPVGRAVARGRFRRCVDPINYARRITIPVLMVNGRVRRRVSACDEPAATVRIARHAGRKTNST